MLNAHSIDIFSNYNIFCNFNSRSIQWRRVICFSFLGRSPSYSLLVNLVKCWRTILTLWMLHFTSLIGICCQLKHGEYFQWFWEILSSQSLLEAMQRLHAYVLHSRRYLVFSKTKVLVRNKIIFSLLFQQTMRMTYTYFMALYNING